MPLNTEAWQKQETVLPSSKQCISVNGILWLIKIHRNLNGIKVWYSTRCFLVVTKYRIRAMTRAGDEKFPLSHLNKSQYSAFWEFMRIWNSYKKVFMLPMNLVMCIFKRTIAKWFLTLVNEFGLLVIPAVRRRSLRPMGPAPSLITSTLSAYTLPRKQARGITGALRRNI